jgi:hypothetical protein
MGAAMGKKVAIYIRVSTDAQTTENQRLELQRVAQVSGWEIVGVYEDAGISGAKGRAGRPAFEGHRRQLCGSMAVAANGAAQGRSVSGCARTRTALPRTLRHFHRSPGSSAMLSLLFAGGFFAFLVYCFRHARPAFMVCLLLIVSFVWRTLGTVYIDLFGPINSTELGYELGPGISTPLFVVSVMTALAVVVWLPHFSV